MPNAVLSSYIESLITKCEKIRRSTPFWVAMSDLKIKEQREHLDAIATSDKREFLRWAFTHDDGFLQPNDNQVGLAIIYIQFLAKENIVALRAFINELATKPFNFGRTNLFGRIRRYLTELKSNTAIGNFKVSDAARHDFKLIVENMFCQTADLSNIYTIIRPLVNQQLHSQTDNFKIDLHHFLSKVIAITDNIKLRNAAISALQNSDADFDFVLYRSNYANSNDPRTVLDYAKEKSPAVVSLQINLARCIVYSSYHSAFNVEDHLDYSKLLKNNDVDFISRMKQLANLDADNLASIALMNETNLSCYLLQVTTYSENWSIEFNNLMKDPLKAANIDRALLQAHSIWESDKTLKLHPVLVHCLRRRKIINDVSLYRGRVVAAHNDDSVRLNAVHALHGIRLFDHKLERITKRISDLNLNEFTAFAMMVRSSLQDYAGPSRLCLHYFFRRHHLNKVQFFLDNNSVLKKLARSNELTSEDASSLLLEIQKLLQDENGKAIKHHQYGQLASTILYLENFYNDNLTVVSNTPHFAQSE